MAVGQAETFAPQAPPDGDLAFNTVRDGNYEVYMMPAEGGAARNITADTGVDWVYGSRDGRLFVVSTREGRWPRPDYDLYSLDPMTGPLERITADFPVYDSWPGFPAGRGPADGVRPEGRRGGGLPHRPGWGRAGEAHGQRSRGL